MIGYIYFKDHKNAIPTAHSGAIKAGAKIGMLVGQLVFGFLGDNTLGRHNVYGRELLFTIFGILMCTWLPWQALGHNTIVIWLTVGRFITGLGLGGGKIYISRSVRNRGPNSLST
jgi:PHS family inorganic phosphate transporter-like MFS transporter